MKLITNVAILLTIIFLDIAGAFSHSDLPFLAVFLTFSLGRKGTFAFALFLLAWMGLSYIPTGAGAVTERIGEWFYLFFVFGLIQYGYEVFRLRK